MGQVQVHDKKFEVYITKDRIQKRVQELAQQIDKDYAGKMPLFIGILNGSFMFASDLFRTLSIPAEISFIKLASYKGTSSTEHVVTAIGMEENLRDRHVIILEDIIDTGKTLHSFLPEIEERGPASVKIASFLTKPEALQYGVKADYVGFEIDNKFVLGYGLDYDRLGRNLPELYILSNNQ